MSKTYKGTNGNDTQTGDNGSDNVFQDYGVGRDVLTGGNKSDVFQLTVDKQLDTIDGKGGNDTVDYSGADRGLWIDLAHGDTWALFEKDHPGFADQVLGGSPVRVTSLSNIENVRGSDYKDTITGDAQDNVIEGGGGADRIDGGNGSDTASYEHSGSGVYVNLNGVLSGLPGQHFNFNGWGGDATGDVLVNIENLKGSAYNDTFVGNSGNNVFTGGDGNDNFVFKGQIGHDTIKDFDAVSKDGSNDFLVFDKAQFKDFDDFWDNTTHVQVGDDVVITIDDHNSITLLGVDLSALEDGKEFHFVDHSDLYLV
jgi:Ca2+-binding RTX toxin-like protein